MAHFLKKFREYTFQEDRQYVDREEGDTYLKYIERMVPKTRQLFELIKTIAGGKLGEKPPA